MVKLAKLAVRKTHKWAKSLRIQDWVSLPTYLGQRFLITRQDYSHAVGHVTLTAHLTLGRSM